MIKCLLWFFASYLSFYQEHDDLIGPLGTWKEGEIEILVDELEIQRAEEITGRQSGVVAQDIYWTWVNDPVRFPSGSYGVYGRIFWNKGLQKSPGVAVLPVDIEKQVVYLNCNYRHATRSWEIELPRGIVEAHETPEEAATRETLEETGLVLDKVHFIGEMLPDTGMCATKVRVFLGEVQSISHAQPEPSEAIVSVVEIPLAKLATYFQAQMLSVSLEEKSLEAHFRDPFLAYALLTTQPTLMYGRTAP